MTFHIPSSMCTESSVIFESLFSCAFRAKLMLWNRTFNRQIMKLRITGTLFYYIIFINDVYITNAVNVLQKRQWVVNKYPLSRQNPKVGAMKINMAREWVLRLFRKPKCSRYFSVSGKEKWDNCFKRTSQRLIISKTSKDQGTKLPNDIRMGVTLATDALPGISIHWDDACRLGKGLKYIE